MGFFFTLGVSAPWREAQLSIRVENLSTADRG